MTSLSSIRGPMMMGWIATLIVVLGIGGWATQAHIAAAVVAPGIVDLATTRHEIQHVEGGRVIEVAVVESQRVRAGDLLLRLDDRALVEELALLDAQIIELRARRARFQAHRDGQFGMSIPPDPQLRPAFELQQNLFNAREESLRHHSSQLAQRRRQAEAELEGMRSQLAALEDETRLVETELETHHRLRESGLVTQGAENQIRREAARLRGSRAAITARIAALMGIVAELNQQAGSLRADLRLESSTAYVEADTALAELSARRALLEARLEQRVLLAPQDGQVQNVVVMPGAVLRPGQSAMSLIATQAEPALVLMVRPEDVDTLFEGQSGRVRVEALVREGIPELPVRIATIAAAPTIDEASGRARFRVDLALDDTVSGGSPPSRLLPGMTLSGFIPIGTRTPMSYFTEPITARLRVALSEP